MMIRRLALLALLILWPSFAWAQATNYCNNQIYQTFEGGVTGGLPTNASLAASSHGLPGSWQGDSSGRLTYTDSTKDMPALVAPGRLCGDSITYPNSPGSHALLLTGDGGLDFNFIQFNFPTPFNLVDATATIEYNEDFALASGQKTDAFVIGGANDKVIVNAYGLFGGTGPRYLSMECPNTNPPKVISCSTTQSVLFPVGNPSPNVTWTPSTQCPCKLIIHYGTGNGTVAGNHNMVVLDKNGALIAAFQANSFTAYDAPQFVRVGDMQNGDNVPAGQHAWWDNLQISFNKDIPGQFCKGASPTWTVSPDDYSGAGIPDNTLQNCINGISAGDTINLLSGTATWVNEVTNFTNKLPMNMIGPTLISGGGTNSPSANDTIPGTSTTIYMNHTSGNGASLGLAVPRSGCPTPTSTIPCIRLSGLTTISAHVGVAGNIQFFDATNTWPPSSARFRADNLHEIILAGSGTGDINYTQDVYGVFDHIWSQNHSTATIVHYAHFGDAVNKGYLGWQSPLALGTDQEVYVETSSAQDDFCNTSGMGDGNQGARAAYRHNYELNGHMSAFHGTDSGSELSMFSGEDYQNTSENNACTTTALTNYTLRGGTMMAFLDTFIGTASWAGGKLQELRADPSVAAGGDWSTWGFANGVPFYVNGLPGTGGSQQVTTNGGDWQPSHSYTCSQAAPCVIIPTSNNAGNFNYVTFSNCTSGSTRPNPFNQAAGSTTPDGSPSCGWINVFGTTSTGALIQFCALNQDIPVAVLINCPVGDQVGPLRFFDGPSSAFGYPARNQVGRSNNGAGTGETLNPVYQWSNTGLPNPGLFSQNDPSHIFINECRDYYQQQGSATFTGACSAGNGVGVGFFANLPATCQAGPGGNTPGVGFWATDKNTLYVCNPTNTWTAYYTPLVYPHPLVSGSGGGGAPIIALCPGINFLFDNIGTTNQALCAIINSGTATLTWSSITVSGAPFTIQAGTCPLTNGSLAANGGTCAFQVTFTPTTQGTFNGTVTVNDNSAGAPHTVALTGSGQTVAPAGWMFAANLSGCRQSAPLVPTWCFTGDEHIYFSSCGAKTCNPFVAHSMTGSVTVQ